MAWWPSRFGLSDDPDPSDLEQALADLAQTHADSDQTASDRDATASERDSAAAIADQVSSDADQRAADADQQSSDRDREADPAPTAAEQQEREESRDERAEARRVRQRAQSSRTSSELGRIQSDAERFETSALRDEVAEERDRAADLREGAARRAEAALLAIHPDNQPLHGVVSANTELRDKAMSDRQRAAVDRRRAAEDRVLAAAGRRQSRIDVQQAQLDGSTGVFARQMGHAALQGEIDRCRRGDDPFVLTYLSIDGLQQRSDRHGSPAADALIAAVVRALRSTLHSYDPVVRIAGDEFLCGLPGTAAAAAEQRVAELRTAVRAGHPPGTISVGFAVLEGEDTLATLMLRSEAAMKRDHEGHVES